MYNPIRRTILQDFSQVHWIHWKDPDDWEPRRLNRRALHGPLLHRP